jgi:outer membrane protein assembly factor BamB
MKGRHVMKLTHFALAAGVLCASWCCLVRADDFPQWRGPNRDGISKEKGLLKQWPDEGPRLLWESRDVGDGYSTPAVVGERLYLMGSKGGDNEFLRAMNVADGKEVWTARIGKVGPNDRAMNYPGARSTPTVDGDTIYTLGSDGDLVALDMSGKEKWRKGLRTDFGGTPGKWAYAESVLIDGDHLICTPGGAQATLVALNKKTGDVVWKCAVPGGDEAGYASAIAADIAGVRQYVQFVQKGVVGVDAKTGKFLWRYAQTAERSPANIPTPVVSGDFVYTAAARSGGGLIRIKRDGDNFVPEQVFFAPKLPSAIGGSVLLNDHLFGTGGQVLYCVDFKTGKVKWTERSVGAGSVLFADDRLYLHGEEGGEVALVEASPDGYKEHGRFTPKGEVARGRGKSWAYPVVANGHLYVRDWGVLWCYDIKAGAAAN